MITQTKLRVNSNVIIRRNINEFHYRSTPFASLQPVLSKLQRRGIRGTVRRIDAVNSAIAVQFPNVNEFLWFKFYEVDTA